MSLAAGGRTLHLPGLSTIKQSEPAEHQSSKKHLILFALCAGIVAVAPLFALLWALPAIGEQKHLNDISGSQGEGFFVADVGRDYSYLPIAMGSWFLAFALEIVVYLLFLKASHATIERYFRKFFGSIFIAFLLSASVIIITISGGYSNTSDQFRDWAKEKYQLSEVGYFSPSSSTLEGKDFAGNMVNLNVVHDKNVFYLYQDNEQLLKIAQDMVQGQK